MHPHTVPPIYRPRRPWTTVLYQAVDRHFETFAAVYDDRFAPVYGDWRPVVRTTAEAYLECGRYEGGFARLRCDPCGTERLLAFSCRRRGLCPSCAARTAALAAQHLVEEIICTDTVQDSPQVIRLDPSTSSPALHLISPVPTRDFAALTEDIVELGVCNYNIPNLAGLS